ncbi:beta-ketoacyl synthase N-terminal-like domain-containing protein [Streptomyces sp. MK7]|uniref:beta-ketoacyl [acyl carrier protein] synthase domain-containing protein n=1 Tax=Streptomyces sp. MK7 TaxID=3067635 RepID=UPI002930CA5D|nr:beta-ketoacyl synthase N-terminal-like domain-containing protein [Streptomyces sp. MK7]
MDNRQILTHYKDGTLQREHALTLLRGALFSAPEPAQLTDVAGPGPRPGAGPARSAEPAAAQGWAVIGIAGRYPGVEDVDSFWHGVLQARDTASQGPGHLIGDIDAFDPQLFGLTEEEATAADPRERLLLEVAWDVLERCGHTGARLQRLKAADGAERSLGVYVAAGRGLPAAGPAAPGGPWRMADRLPELLDLRGPSCTVDTAESSFLTAVHQALNALTTGECAAALVAAADLGPRPAPRPEHGEAVCAVLLKPLAAARADGDLVHAVIRAGVVAQRGRGGRAAAEDRLLRATAHRTGITPDDITLWETPQSVARCVGDAGAATGGAALTRAVLQLHHATLAPNLPGAEAVPWAPSGPDGAPVRRRAAVTVHGSGGVCGQLVLEEDGEGAAADAVAPRAEGEQLVLLSAPTPRHLTGTARQLARWAAALQDAGKSEPTAAEVAAELRTGRAAGPCRLAVIVRDLTQLTSLLEEFGREGPDPEGPGAVRRADLRGREGRPPLLEDVPETRAYVRALWQSGRNEQLARLWLAGVDVGAEAPPPPRVVRLPGTAVRPHGSADAGSDR